MKHKDYTEIAKIIRRHIHNADSADIDKAIQHLAKDIIDYFSKDVEDFVDFDKELFLKEIGVDI